MIVSLVVLLALGVGLNLYILDKSLHWLRSPGSTIVESPTAPPWPRELLDIEFPKESVHTYVYGWEGLSDEFILYTPIEAAPDTESGQANARLRVDDIVRQTGKPFVVRSERTRAIEWWGDSLKLGGGMQGPVHRHYHAAGLILNPIIYALPVWIVVVGIYLGVCTLIRRARRGNGLCEHCAYDTQGLAKCPECGTESSLSAIIEA